MDGEPSAPAGLCSPVMGHRVSDRPLVELCFAAGLAASLAGCGGGPDQDRPPNVVILSVDSLRQDHLGAYGHETSGPRREPISPVFDSLAQRGVLFENARSTTSWTLPSHMALFTGLPDPLHGVTENRRRLAPGLATLTELFKEAGYATAGFFSGPNLHPTFGFGRGFDDYVDCSDVTLPPDAFSPDPDAEPGSMVEVHRTSHAAITSPSLVESASRYADAVLGDDQPLFLFVHWWDPHYDYLAPSDYVERFTSGDYTGSFTGDHYRERMQPASARDARHLRELYDAEIRFTDDEIGRLLEVLERHDALDSTIVVYGSDHGEDFYEHGRWGHQRNLFETSVRIPLTIAGPGVPGGVRARGNAQLHDLFTTLTNLCGIEAPDYVEGRDLAALWNDPTAAGPPSTLHIAVPMREIALTALVDGSHKAIYDHEDGRTLVYDLEGDPNEQRPLTPAESGPDGESVAKALEAELERLEQKRAELPTAGESELDAQLIDQLERMGYGVEADPDDESPR